MFRQVIVDSGAFWYLRFALKKGASSVFFDIAFKTLKGFSESRVFLAVPSDLGGEETHGTHMGQAKRAHDLCQAIATELLTEIHRDFAGSNPFFGPFTTGVRLVASTL